MKTRTMGAEPHLGQHTDLGDLRLKCIYIVVVIDFFAASLFSPATRILRDLRCLGIQLKTRLLSLLLQPCMTFVI